MRGRQVADVSFDFAAVSGRPRALPPLAGRRSQRSAAAVHDREQARWRRRVVLHDGRQKIPTSSQPTSKTSAQSCHRSRRWQTDVPSSYRWSLSHERSWQLPRYLETMEEAGLQEVFLPVLKGQGDGRLWRTVPGRRWYSDQRGATPGSQEVVLIHRKHPAQ